MFSWHGKMTPRYVLSSLDTLCTYTMYVLQLKFTKSIYIEGGLNVFEELVTGDVI
jgi:hypothetical protein